MRIRIFYHDHCFDGAASAAYFSRFMEGAFHPGAEFVYSGLAHRASQLFDDSLFDCDENAIVDFKYSSNPKLTWWFDHHQSAFLTPRDAEHFRLDRSGRKLYDPSFKSCTLVIEGAKGSGIVHKIIGWMRHRPLEEIVAEREIQGLYQPLYERHLNSI